MNDFSTQKSSRIESLHFRTLIVITLIVGLVGAAIVWGACGLGFFCLNPILVLLGALFSVATILLYAEIATLVLLGTAAPVRLVFLVVAKGLLITLLLLFLWVASRTQQLALLIGVASFMPAALSLCWAEKGQGGRGREEGEIQG